jgi:hypothetical protein
MTLFEAFLIYLLGYVVLIWYTTRMSCFRASQGERLIVCALWPLSAPIILFVAAMALREEEQIEW